LHRLRATHDCTTTITTTTTISPTITTKDTTTTTITTTITATPSASLNATPVPRWRHHPMHKHMLCFKQWPVQRRWLWCSSASASASAAHMPQHLLYILLRLWQLLTILLRELMA
jgi:hypothetical protein